MRKMLNEWRKFLEEGSDPYETKNLRWGAPAAYEAYLYTNPEGAAASPWTTEWIQSDKAFGDDQVSWNHFPDHAADPERYLAALENLRGLKGVKEEKLNKWIEAFEGYRIKHENHKTTT